ERLDGEPLTPQIAAQDEADLGARVRALPAPVADLAHGGVVAGARDGPLDALTGEERHLRALDHLDGDERRAVRRPRPVAHRLRVGENEEQPLGVVAPHRAQPEARRGNRQLVVGDEGEGIDHAGYEAGFCALPLPFDTSACTSLSARSRMQIVSFRSRTSSRVASLSVLTSDLTRASIDACALPRSWKPFMTTFITFGFDISFMTRGSLMSFIPRSITSFLRCIYRASSRRS